MRFCILGSGSSANSFAIETARGICLLDAGLPLRTLKKRLLVCGWKLEDIRAVWITHTHADHVRGLEALLDSTRAVLVHRLGLSWNGVFKKNNETNSVEFFEPDEPKSLAGLDYLAFSTYHDAPLSVGFHFHAQGTRYTLITDTGKTDEKMITLASRSDVLFLECNYCPELLEAGTYPRLLKDRVQSDYGHLSNHQTRLFLDALGSLGESRLKVVYLIHLSANNNSIERVCRDVVEKTIFSGRIIICPRGKMVQDDGKTPL